MGIEIGISNECIIRGIKIARDEAAVNNGICLLRFILTFGFRLHNTL